MKRLICLLIAAALALPLAAFKFPEEHLLCRLLGLGELPESPEFASVWDCVPGLMGSLDDEVEKAGVTAYPEAIAFDRAMRAYPAELPLTEESFDKAASSPVTLWRVPIAREKGFVYATFRLEEGEPVTYETGASDSFDSGVRVSYVFEGGELDRAVEESGLKPSEARILSFDELKADMIVFRADGRLYAIPYFENPPDGVENKRVIPFGSLILAVSRAVEETEIPYPLGAYLPDTPDYEGARGFDGEMRRQADSLADALTVIPARIRYGHAAQVFLIEKLGSYADIEAARTSGEYLWKIPVVSEGQHIVSSLRAKDGRLTGCSTEAGSAKSSGQTAYIFDRSLVENAIAESGLDAGDVIVCSVPSAFVDFVSFKAGGGDYVIPFAARPDFWDLENGRVYELDEMIPEVEKLIANSDPFGGASGVSPLWLIAGAAALAAAITLVVIWLRRRAGMKR